MYKGNVIKTVNMMNQTLAEQFPDSAKLKLAQDSIDKQLKSFEAKLWLAKDTVQTVANAKNKKATKSSARTTARSNNSSSNTKKSAAKSSNTSSSPTKSVRRK